MKPRPSLREMSLSGHLILKCSAAKFPSMTNVLVNNHLPGISFTSFGKIALLTALVSLANQMED